LRFSEAATFFFTGNLFILFSQVQKLKAEVKDMFRKCQEVERKKLEASIKHFPQTQQDIVLAFHKMTVEKGPTARRYVLNWIYECILMRIKSPALYHNIREKGILPLPCRATIARYMRKLHPMFGYQDTLFEVIKKKVAGWREQDRNGKCIRTILLHPKHLYDSVSQSVSRLVAL